MAEFPEGGKKEDAVSDDNLKLHQLIDRQGKKAAKGKRATALLSNMFQASMTGPVRSHTEGMPMITLKHRWMRNRNLVAGTTTVSFDNDGVAKVQNIGNARLDCEQLCRQYPGLIEMTDEAASEAAPAAAPAPAEAPKVPEEPEAPEEPQEAAEEPAEDDAEPETAAQETAPPKKKAPPRKRKK